MHYLVVYLRPRPAPDLAADLRAPATEPPVLREPAVVYDALEEERRDPLVFGVDEVVAIAEFGVGRREMLQRRSADCQKSGADLRHLQAVAGGVCRLPDLALVIHHRN